MRCSRLRFSHFLFSLFLLQSVVYGGTAKLPSLLRQAIHSLKLEAKHDIAGNEIIFDVSIDLKPEIVDARWALEIHRADGALIGRFDGRGTPRNPVVWEIPPSVGDIIIYQFLISSGGITNFSPPQAVIISGATREHSPGFNLELHPSELTDDTPISIFVTPFSPVTDPGSYRLAIMNTTGENVRSIQLTELPARVIWDGVDGDSNAVESGIYMAAITRGSAIVSNPVLFRVRRISMQAAFFSVAIRFQGTKRSVPSESSYVIDEIISFLKSHPGSAMLLSVGIPTGDPVESMKLAAARVESLVSAITENRAIWADRIELTDCELNSDEIGIRILPTNH